MKIVTIFVLSCFGVIYTAPANDESMIPQEILDVANWVPETDVSDGTEFPIFWDREKYSLTINLDGMLELIPRDLLIQTLLLEDEGKRSLDEDRSKSDPEADADEDDAPTPLPDLSMLDWDLEANLSLPFSWDRSKWVLSISMDGMLMLVDRDSEIRDYQESRSFDAVKETEFLLFSRAKGGNPVKFSYGQIGSLPSYGFKKDLPTKILIHGYMGGSNSEVITPLAKEYLKKGDVNVIGVNWARGAWHISYGKVRNRIPMVADLVATLIKKLLHFGQVSDQIGLIGHSLGAHVAGLVGKKIRPKVAYIVGLDPAGPKFQLSKPQERLADTDAKYVEVIHTNGDSLGFFKNLGTADFYPNGGKKQPGCGLPWLGWFYRICSHTRAVTVFKESLMAKGYFANRCADLNNLNSKCSLGRVEFGEVHVHPLMAKPRGVYYFETNAKFPFLKTSRPKVHNKQSSTILPNSTIASIQSQESVSYTLNTQIEVQL